MLRPMSEYSRDTISIEDTKREDRLRTKDVAGRRQAFVVAHIIVGARS